MTSGKDRGRRTGEAPSSCWWNMPGGPGVAPPYHEEVLVALPRFWGTVPMTQTIMGTWVGKVRLRVCEKLYFRERLVGSWAGRRKGPGNVGETKRGSQEPEGGTHSGGSAKGQGAGLSGGSCCLTLGLLQERVSVQSPGKARADQLLGRALQTKEATTQLRVSFKVSDMAYTISTVTSAQRQDSLISPHVDGSVGMCVHCQVTRKRYTLDDEPPHTAKLKNSTK